MATSNDQLLDKAQKHTRVAELILRATLNMTSIDRKITIIVLDQLRGATAAVQELDNRLAGNPPAQEG